MTFEQVFKNIITDYEGTDFLTYYDNGKRIVMTKGICFHRHAGAVQ